MMMSKEHELIHYLNKERLVLGTAESCTAGRVMSELALLGHCGDCLFLGYAVYQQAAKIKQLNVSPQTIDQFGLTSEEVALEMAQGVFQHPEINTAIATTGIIGREPMDGLEPGTICFAWAFKKNQIIKSYSVTHHFSGTPREMQSAAASYALNHLVFYHQKSLHG